MASEDNIQGVLFHTYFKENYNMIDLSEKNREEVIREKKEAKLRLAKL